MQTVHYISSDYLSLKAVEDLLLNENTIIELSEESKAKIEFGRNYLDEKLSSSDQLIYGINTGFGSLCNIRISEKETIALQRNLMQSHACGIGAEVPFEIVRLMLFLKIQNLSYGYSGSQLITVQRLIRFYNNKITPIVFQQGSLGASGDLAPLAHLSLPLIGLGEVRIDGQKLPANKLENKFNWQPVSLKSKEGLALLNGTQFSGAYGTWCLIHAKRLTQIANIVAAISIDAFNCRMSPFDNRIHQVRPHPGQLETAAFIRTLLEGSEIAYGKKNSVQDPYAFRCTPQVHGATMDAIAHIEQVFIREINSVTDNPTIFPEDDVIISGGNFHAQPLAINLDYLAIALSELGSISERRLYQLISGQRELPEFLTIHAGLHSGMMIAQYTAASIASQNKQLCTPASVDSIISCNGQEDHVSMAANAATKAYQVVLNLERLLAIEFMAAAQALSFRRPKKSSAVIEDLIEKYRKVVPVLETDRILSTDIQQTIAFLKTVKYNLN